MKLIHSNPTKRFLVERSMPGILFLICFTLLTHTGTAQTLAPTVMPNAPAAGEYYYYTGTQLSTGFSFTASAGHTLHIYYIPPPDCQKLAALPKNNQNYIVTYVPRQKQILNPADTSHSTCEVMQSIQYFDGLGRPIQTVQVKGSPSGADVVQPMAYDDFGRETKKYLPYTITAAISGSYQANAVSDQSTFYQRQSNGTGVVNIPVGQIPYAETRFDNSPLNRPLENGAPGFSWQIGGGHTASEGYYTNTSADAVKLWTVNPSGGAYYNTSYPAGTLYKTVATDENQHSVITFKNVDNQVVSRWVQNTSGYVVTDYVYDDLDNLRYVITPLPSASGINAAVTMPTSFAETDAVFQNFFYGYHYDGLKRLTEKKIPGQDWQYIVYNQMDKPVLTQDANQRNKGIWMVTKYDGLGRVVMTGTMATTTTRDVLQGAINFVARSQFETFINSTSNYGYDNGSYPTLTDPGMKIMTVNYYDNYNILSNSAVAPGGNFTGPAAVDSLERDPKGMMTATMVNVLGTTNYLFTVTHYDQYGRPVKVITQHAQGGSVAVNKYDTEETQYSFNNIPTQSIRKHYQPAGIQLTINSWNTYDHMNRKLLAKQQFITPSVTGGVVTLSKLDYNELGQLITKHLHSTNTSVASNTFLQHVNYRYNSRGWLSRINNPANLADENYGNFDVFAEQLDYDQNVNGYSTFVPNYNGNISTMSWQTKLPATLASMSPAPSQEQKGYILSYDVMNRLTSALAKAQTSGDNQYNELLSYDELGNIVNLTRQSPTGTLNNLTYNYMNGVYRSNKLVSVADAGTEAYTSTYTYDTNGNVTGDTKKAVSGMTYNELNLPLTVPIGTKTLTYLYDATGKKLERTTSTGEDRSYVNGIEYNGSTIDLVHTEEGRALPSSGNYIYQYNIADHLGNTRALFSDADNNGSLSTSEILQVTDYYAFGRDITPLATSTPQRYKYNGKELQDDLGQYDYGARFYDPVIARWNTIDPLAEKDRRWSQYNYVMNNPIRMVDPDGMAPADPVYLQHQEDVSNFNKTIGNVMAQYWDTNGAAGAHQGGDSGPKQNLVNKEKSKAKTSSANQGGDPPLTHAQELAKYGYVTGGFNVSGTLSLGTGGTVELGWVTTNKNYVQYYRTVYYTSTAAAAFGVNGFFVINRDNNKTTFSDWAGPVFGGAVNYGDYSGIYGISSTYHEVGGGIGAGLSFKFFGSGSVGYTTLMGDPVYSPPYDEPGTHVIK
jgi:RHS repeat-associated protein